MLDMTLEACIFLSLVGGAGAVAGLHLHSRGRVMVSSVLDDLDLIEELRLRRWARENFVPIDQRQTNWHPVILEEMDRKDDEKSPHGAILVGSEA
jgi:hypothetical protein